MARLSNVSEAVSAEAVPLNIYGLKLSNVPYAGRVILPF
jgi:hypothetical protein